MNDAVAQPQAFQVMKTDIEISMDDVVSAFVSQYENNLFARKKELGKDIQTLEKQLKDIEKEVGKKVTGTEYKQKLPFGLVCIIDDGTICWGEHSNHVVFNITIEEKASSRYSNRITIIKTKPIPVASIRAHDKIVKKLDAVRGELSEVLVNLKSVNRKERQVRGRIAIRKLEDSGYANLMQDEELVQLVQLD